MSHLIKTLVDQPINLAIQNLTEAHLAVSNAILSSYKQINLTPHALGSDFKRLFVELPDHVLIGKKKERFVELINILATVEKTIDALAWMNNEFKSSWLAICHPSTSDSDDGNDIVLLDSQGGKVIARCEVTDVISSKAGQNGKEAKDLKSLSCGKEVPSDGIRRFISTSPEFANALSSPKRKWALKHYRYQQHVLKNAGRTVVLEIYDGSA